MWRRGLLVGCLVAACGGPSGPDADVKQPDNPDIPATPGPDPTDIVGLVIAPRAASLRVTDTLTFSVRAVQRGGDTVTVSGARWSTAAPASVATIDSVTGTFTARAIAGAQIVVSWRGMQAYAEVSMHPRCRGISLIPSGPPTLRVGEQATWKPIISSCEGWKDTTFAFSSTDSTTLRISPLGIGVALKAGMVGVTLRLVNEPTSPSTTVGVTINP